MGKSINPFESLEVISDVLREIGHDNLASLIYELGHYNWSEEDNEKDRGKVITGMMMQWMANRWNEAMKELEEVLESGDSLLEKLDDDDVIDKEQLQHEATLGTAGQRLENVKEVLDMPFFDVVDGLTEGFLPDEIDAVFGQTVEMYESDYYRTLQAYQDTIAFTFLPDGEEGEEE